MPIIFEKKEQHFHMAIWKITEEESFFSNQIYSNFLIKHPKRRIEFLTGRFLLKFLNPKFPVEQIIISPKGKPQIPDSNLHFSISHSYPFVAAIIGLDKAVGVDIQTYSEKVQQIQNKFLSMPEQELCENNIETLTIAWSAKEAVYKYYGLGNLNFKEDMPIKEISWYENHAKIRIDLEVTRESLRLSGFCEKNFAVVWI